MTTATGLTTHTGAQVDAWTLEHHPELVNLDDIAHSLSLINRFGGHAPYPYSVAQHSLLVASVLPDELKPLGLLHDAAEAYIGDMVSPVKRGLSKYMDLDQRITRAILAKYNLPAIGWQVIRADLAVGAAECAAFGINVNPEREIKPADVQIHFTPYHIVKYRFRQELAKYFPKGDVESA